MRAGHFHFDHKEEYVIDVSLFNMDVFSSTLQSAWQDRDAAHVARERTKRRYRLGISRFFQERCAPTWALRFFLARRSQWKRGRARERGMS